MTVDPATLTLPPVVDPPVRFVPTGEFRGTLDQFDYTEEEWFATGQVDGHSYSTALTVRRPRDASRFSGTVMVEPVHAASAAPIWIYTSTYQMRAGHGWAAVLLAEDRPRRLREGRRTRERYASLDIWSDAPPPRGVGHRGHAAAPVTPRVSGPHGADAPGQRAVDAHPGPGRGRAGDCRRAVRRARRAPPRPDRALPDRRRGDRLRPQRPRRPASRGRLAGLWRFLPERGAVRALRAGRRPDCPGAERRRHRRPQPGRPGGSPVPPRTTATTRPTATGSTSWPGSATWAPATRLTTTTPCGRTTPWAPPEASQRARP